MLYYLLVVVAVCFLIIAVGNYFCSGGHGGSFRDPGPAAGQ